MLKPYFETTTGQLFTAGIKILVQVSIEFHPSFGLSLNIKDIDPVYIVGDLAVQRREILVRLENEGVLSMNKEIELPLVPQKVAVISSKTAAGFEDFNHQLQGNEYGFRFYIRLFEAFMQGTEAVPSIIAALEKIYRYEEFFDAVVIIRGGGGAADLSCFDNYDLAMNIAQFPLPVITGIGHEKDDTIADKVAHTRLKTPTAVAEFLIKDAERFYEKLNEYQDEIVRITKESLEYQNSNLEEISRGFTELVLDYIRDKNQILAKKGNDFLQKVRFYSFRKQLALIRLKHKLESVCSVWRIETHKRSEFLKKIVIRISKEKLMNESKELKQLHSGLTSMLHKRIEKESKLILSKENMVRVLDPENVLKRGFSLTFKNGNLVKSVNNLHLNDEIETRISDGSLKSKITKKDTYDK